MTWLALPAVVALVATNAVFVATEFALVASRPSQLQKRAQEGSRAASSALTARSDLRRQMSGAQLGITLSSVALGILAEPAIGPAVASALEPIGVPATAIGTVSWLVALSAASVFQMLFGELVPKNLAIADPERTLDWVMPVHRVFVTISGPAILLLDRVAALLVRPLGLSPVNSLEHSLGAAELSAVLAASRKEGLIEGFEHDLLASALDLGSRQVTSVMIPRASMVMVDRRATLAEIENVIVRTGHSRLPVYGIGPDDLLGFFHVKDLLRLPPEAQGEPVPLELRRWMLVVEPDLPLDDLLVRMRRSRSHLAAVRDANGRNVGLVTMEDVIEELVGDIRDESDVVDPGS
ncbi:MAG: hemolysin family protein [Actinomycetota bacterium]|nr:hemolysin family protein [Actinomycetota bacterium]